MDIISERKPSNDRTLTFPPFILNKNNYIIISIECT